MAMKYHGTMDQLRGWLEELGVRGSWEEQPNGVRMLRKRDGANLHFAVGSKSLWFSGTSGAREELAALIEQALPT